MGYPAPRASPVTVRAGVRGGPDPVEEPPYGRVLAVDGKTLAVAFEKVVAELHHGADADVIDLGDVPFLKEAGDQGLVQLKGHRMVGGMRASIYNAMPLEGVQTLVEFMRDFERRHG